MNPTTLMAPRKAERRLLDPLQNYEWLNTLPFVGAHLAVFGIFWSGWTWGAVICCICLFAVRMFGVTAGYHRYFSHRSFKTSRVFQFLLAVLAQTSAQKGVLWWAAHHRYHHRHADREDDVHSPRQHGFWYSHVGWLWDHNSDTKLALVRDLARYAELRWLNRFYLLPPMILAITVFWLLGWSGLLIGFCLSTVILWHSTFSINSLAHIWGRRRYPTKDDSKNSFILSLMTLGEGWHNNHHYFPASVRQGFYWWEVDFTYYMLQLLKVLGCVWDLSKPPAAILREGDPRKRPAEAVTMGE